MPTYSSNTQQILTNITNILKEASNPKEIIEVASEELLGFIQWRIWNDYKATNGTLIGRYDTKPMYSSLDFNRTFVRSIGSGSGKNSKKATFKNGKKRNSKYYKGGYKEYKKDVKGTSKVNLELTGRLKNSFKRTVNGNTAIIEMDAYGQEVGGAMQVKYAKDIFMASKSEIKQAVLSAEEHVRKKINKL